MTQVAEAVPMRERLKAAEPARWAIPVIVLAAAVAPMLALLRLPLQGVDEGLLLVHPIRMSQGGTLHADFASLYGPTGFHVLQAVFAPWGPSLLAERLLATAYHAIIAGSVWTLLRHGGRNAALLAGLSSAVILVPLNPVALAWIGGASAALAGLAILSLDPQNRWAGRATLLCGGALMASAAGFRLEMLVLLVAAWPLVRGRDLATFGFGVALGLTPLAAHSLDAGQQMLHLWTDRVGADFKGDLGSTSAATWILLAAVTIAPAVGLLLWRHPIATRGFRALTLLAALSLPMVWQRPDWIHGSLVGCYSIPLLVWAAVRVAGTRRPKATQRIANAIAVIVVSALAAFSALGLAQAGGVSFMQSGRSLFLTQSQATDLQDLIARMRDVAVPGSRVYIGPQDFSEPVLAPTWISFLLPDYTFDQYYEESVPGVTERDPARTISDLSRSDVLLLVDLSAQGRWLFPRLPDGPETVNQYVAGHFCEVAQVREYVLMVPRTSGEAGGSMSACP